MVTRIILRRPLVVGPALFLTALLASASATEPTRVTVEVTGTPSSNGNVRVALWKGEGTFLKGQPYRSASPMMTDGKALAEFTELDPGEYAISAFLDKNNNGKMDRSFVGKPKEPFGFSNGARGTFGPPMWQDARFELVASGKTIAVQLK
jgi:uncharacterized protein (DUF2141 family)